MGGGGGGGGGEGGWWVCVSVGLMNRWRQQFSECVDTFEGERFSWR